MTRRGILLALALAGCGPARECASEAGPLGRFGGVHFLRCGGIGR